MVIIGLIFPIILIGIVVFIINKSINMNSEPKTSAKDFFLNLGAIVALYVLVINLLMLLFTVINRAYPKIGGYNYFGSSSISWPVATLIIVFPIFVFLMWLLEKNYRAEPEKRQIAVKRWLIYITLFVAGVALAVDLVTVLYYFIDGQELSMAFMMKVLSVFVVAGMVFYYYISEIREKLDSKKRKIWFSVVLVVILASIIWGFSVLGSPRTQRLYKYDNQKVNDLQNIDNGILNYYSQNGGILPTTLDDLGKNNYFIPQDSQSQSSYEYKKTGNSTYDLCAEFNNASDSNDVMNNSRAMYPYSEGSWVHPAGYYCFSKKVPVNIKVYNDTPGTPGDF